MLTLTKTITATLPLILVGGLLLHAGCDDRHRSDGNATATGEPAWPISNAPPDNGPRDLLRRCHNATRDGNSREYLACYRGNNPSYQKVFALSFVLIRAHLKLLGVLEERYGQDAPKRFEDMGSSWQPTDLGGRDWPSQGTMKWDGKSDDALWYEYDLPEEDQSPRQLRRLGKHWCFVIRENPTPCDDIIHTLTELIEKAEKATEAAQKGPSEYTLEQVGGIFYR